MLPPFIERYSFHRRFEPVGNAVLHGAGQDPGVGNRYDPSPFHNYWQAMAVEQRPMFYMSYVPLKANMPAYFRRLRQALAMYKPYQVMPQIGLYMNGEGEHGTGEAPYDSAVAQGQFDTQIQAFCNELRSLADPAFVRIGFEFNGPWNGYRPDMYIQTWQRIVAAFQTNHVDNVATVWCYCPLPSTREEPNAGRVDRDYRAFYPGDEWVDWWSIDLFSSEMFSLDNTQWFLEKAATHGFPVMIGESTPRWIGGIEQEDEAWTKWFHPFFTFIRAQPTIKAFCYINWAWDNYPEFQGWGDARIEVNPRLLDRYTMELAQPHANVDSEANP
jgi:hypothetical protein